MVMNKADLRQEFIDALKAEGQTYLPNIDDLLELPSYAAWLEARITKPETSFQDNIEVKLTRNDVSENSKLAAVKLIKEITGLSLKEAKAIVDAADVKSAIFKLNEMITYREYDSSFNIRDITTNWFNCIDKFDGFGYKLKRNNERELKLKRVLYSDQIETINRKND